jgi:hypothetical protein
MKRFTEQLVSKAESVRLSTAEKNDLRERLISYIEYHPLSVELKEKDVMRNGATALTPVRLVRVNLWRVAQWSIASLGVFLFSVSYLAERSVPGDALYAVKVSINEEVRGTLARSPYEKIVWETERLNRRIAEARLLASEGRLTEEVEAEVALAVKEHGENARREIAVLKTTDKEEAALATIQLETTLAVQATAFMNGNDATDIVALAAGTQKPSRIASAIEEAQVAGEADELPTYVRLSAYVERETTRAYELLKSIDDAATLEEKADIARRLEDISRVIFDAATTREVDETAAREELVTVLERTQRLIVFMNNIDIRSEVSVEDIVPVTLTVEERNAKIAQDLVEMNSLLTQIDEALVVMTLPVELAEKILPALENSREVASSTKVALPVSESELETIEITLRDALAVTRDTVTALGLTLEESQISEGLVIQEEAVQEPETGIEASSTATSTVEVVDERGTSTEEVELEV